MKSKKQETTVIKGKVVGVIDCTPTWVGILPYYLTVLQDGNEKGKEIARKELKRMAEIADLYVAMQKAEADGNKAARLKENQDNFDMGLITTDEYNTNKTNIENEKQN
jgi:hypothetical protein